MPETSQSTFTFSVKRYFRPLNSAVRNIFFRLGLAPQLLLFMVRLRLTIRKIQIRPHASGQGLLETREADACGQQLRQALRKAALMPPPSEKDTIDILFKEIIFLHTQAARLRPIFKMFASKRVLYAGQGYYNCWYASRALRDRGWKADVLNWDLSPATQIYYHGEDFRFTPDEPYDLLRDLRFYVASLYEYDVFHFNNAWGMCFGFSLQSWFKREFSLHDEIQLLKQLGKVIVYSNNGCMDGVAQSSFAKWGPEPPCSTCRWRNEPSVCNDERNLAWGAFRNAMADYQCNLGSNRVDYNRAPTVHETPEFYCLDKNIWDPTLPIPQELLLPETPKGTIHLYHAVGHRKERTSEHGVNIKSSHIYGPLIAKLKAEGMALDLIEPTGIPNKDVRFLQMQADIFLDMLTFGWFGANGREAMMLGKPVICFLRPEWIEDIRREIPDYIAELPIISATPDTVEAVLRDLIAQPEKRRAIGEKSRAFAIKWHDKEAAGSRLDTIYRELLQGNPMLLEAYA